MTLEDLRSLFTNESFSQGDEGNDDGEDEKEMDENDEDAAVVEGLNVAEVVPPPTPPDFDIPPSDSELVVEEEWVGVADLEKPSENAENSDSVATTAANELSAKETSSGVGVGMGCTPANLRGLIPEGCKIQHKRSAVPEQKAHGYQAWPLIGPSRWFSYGSPSARYLTQEEALHEAVKFLKGN